MEPLYAPSQPGHHNIAADEVVERQKQEDKGMGKSRTNG